MGSRRSLPILLLLVLLGAAPAAAPGPAATVPDAVRPIAIRAGRLIDGTGAPPVANAVVLVTGERITAVGKDVVIPAGAEVIDLSSATVLPGLIDCHTHLLLSFRSLQGGEADNTLLVVGQMSTAKRALLGARTGREVLEAGITTVRDLGNSGLNGDVALRDAINAGWVPGPRIVASTRALSAAGGQFGALAPEAQKLIDQEYVVVSGVEEARRAVRQAFYDGADAIKVIVDTFPRVLSLEEVQVIVAEAHRVGRKVAAHAVTDLAVRIAAEAGVDSVDHGYGASDAAFKLMAEHKVFLVPTDFPPDIWTALLGRSEFSPEERARIERNFTAGAGRRRDRLARARKAGVRIAAGSDLYFEVPGKTRGEASLAMLRSYAESGMAPAEILRAATADAAELLGWQDRVGTLEPRKYADLIAVGGDPLKDIAELERVRFVMKGGKVIKNQLPAPAR